LKIILHTRSNSSRMNSPIDSVLIGVTSAIKEFDRADANRLLQRQHQSHCENFNLLTLFFISQ
jgi:hypothetical protein